MNKLSILKLIDYLFLSVNGTLINIKKCIIKNTSLINFDGRDKKEKIYFLIENDQIIFDTYSVFEELKNDKSVSSFEFLLDIKNKIALKINLMILKRIHFLICILDY